MRVRSPLFIDTIRKIKVNPHSKLKFSLTLEHLSSPQAISESLTASAHFARIKFIDQNERQEFILNCIGCHQMGNPYTRVDRTKEDWTAFVSLMLDRIDIHDPLMVSRYVSILSSSFDGAVVNYRQKHEVDSSILNARIREWKLPKSVIGHDMIVHSDGKFYTIDMGVDWLYITDPVTNITENIKIPDNNLPLGGKIINTPAAKRAVFAQSIRHGPHSLQEGPDGKIYMTNVVSDQIGVFDPKTRSFKGYDIGENSIYPHTLRFDRDGILWFTLGLSNQVGRLDISTGKMTVTGLPENNNFPYPYGIDINPIDGSVWYSKLLADRIGRIDSKTLSVEEYFLPIVGPRRLRFSKDGMLWIPGFASSSLVKYNSQTLDYSTYSIPTLAPDEVETPYAVYVNPKTQDVWLTANQSDRLFRFLPEEERFIAYPLPSRGSYMRDLAITKNNNLCGTISPVPATHTEGGMQSVLCIDPGE